VASLAKVFACLPESLAYSLGEGAGRLAFRLDRRHREIAVENLARAFPDVSSAEQVRALAQSVFESLGRTAVDVARSGEVLSGKRRDAAQVDGFDRLLEAKRRGRGVLMLGAHFGPWELLPVLATLYYEPIHVVARPLDNPWLDDLLTSLRERGGNRVIRKQDAVLAILQVLRRGETVGIMIDQHITEKEGIVVPFFGRPASTVSAPALIAIRSGAAVLPVGILREGRGRYRVRIAEEVAVRRSGDLRADLAENTARFTAAIEAVIREQPDQWFWVHRRWKTRHPIDPRLETGTWKPDADSRVGKYGKLHESAGAPPVPR
jgi:KDO2-lipid IV(A) lauroyltransferase